MRFVAGLDLGGTNIKGALLSTDSEGTRVIATSVIATLAHLGPEAIVERLAAAATELEPAPGDRIEAVGITVPGTFDAATGVVTMLPNLPGWEGFALVDLLSEALGVEVSLINDSQAFTLAEGLLGAGAGAPTMIGVTLGTGIGGGILIDGRLHTGAFGSAGEFGHQTIVPDGPPCGCGNRGCLEALARPPVVAAAAGCSDFEEVMAAFGDDDQRAVAAIERMVDHLGIGIANVLTILGPHRVVVGGGAAQAGPALIDMIHRAAARRAHMIPDSAIDIVGAQFGQEAGAIGAALYAARTGSGPG